jgi:hypothetical protein
MAIHSSEKQNKAEEQQMNPIAPIQINDLLNDIAANDRRGDYVAPNAGRAEELGRLIASELGAQFSRLAGKARTEGVNLLGPVWISARNDVFSRFATDQIGSWLRTLRRQRPTEVEVALHNTVCSDNMWGDLCAFAIRSSPKTEGATATERPGTPAAAQGKMRDRQTKEFRGPWKKG